jgi:hypothetical protein
MTLHNVEDSADTTNRDRSLELSDQVVATSGSNIWSESAMNPYRMVRYDIFWSELDQLGWICNDHQ